MSIIQGNAKQGSTRGFYPKTIEGSLRFNDDDSTYLEWTPDSAGTSSTIWTFSWWQKSVGMNNSGTEVVFGAADGSNRHMIRFDGSGQLEFVQATTTVRVPTAKFRDPSAWYHFVVSVSGTTVEIYVNGTEITDFTTSNSPSGSWYIGNQYTHRIGRDPANADYQDGYLAEVHFTDGTAYNADAFGEFKNGVWVAKTPDVTYGTNGFYLNFQDDAEVEAFNTVLYRGNGGAQSITGFGFAPDLVWVKRRDTSENHNIFDTVRGTEKRLFSNLTNAENTSSGTLTSFDSDGFSTTGFGDVNASGGTFVAWGWKAGDSNVSNTDGTITSTVRANDTYGFSIVSYTGTGSAATVGHGLSTAPDMVIVKSRSFADNWEVYHSSLPTPATDAIRLNSTNVSFTVGGYWNGGTTSSVFGVSSYAQLNQSGDTFIAYCWAEKTGYSKFGSYSGTDSAGVTVTTGFKPAMLIIKATNLTENWVIIDNTRDTTDPHSSKLEPNTSDAEASGSQFDIEFTDTGFVLNGTDDEINGYSGGTGEYIYAAFADTREAAFWLDQSGNDNDWQPVNLDHNDTVADSPTNNFATLNPFNGGYNPTGTLSDGNLRVTTNNAGTETYGTMAIPSSGQYYWEATVEVSNSAYLGIGALRYSATLIRYRYLNDGQKDVNGTTSAYGASFSAGDVIGVAVDADAETIEFYKNGTGQGSFSIDLSLGDFFPLFMDGNSGASSTFVVNFGQQPFKYDPPAQELDMAYLPLSTDNLPDPAINPAQGSSPADYFASVIYTGNGSSQTISVGFQPDLTWCKNRSSAYGHSISNAVSGATKYLQSDATDVEQDNSTHISAFTSNGFTVGSHVTTNENTASMVAWNWKANGSGVSNTDGSITSTVSANTESGFSIVTYTGNQTNGATVGHGLSQTPEMIITKSRNQGVGWAVWHTGLSGITYWVSLNGTAGESVDDMYTAVNSSTFALGVDNWTNGNTYTFVSYCFHSVEGYSKFGSYTGNGSADGPFVYTGFRPAFVMIKRTDSTGAWNMADSARNSVNVVDKYVNANDSAAEGTYTFLDFTSNGFKIRNTGSTFNTGTLIYMAFAENPFKYSNAR